MWNDWSNRTQVCCHACCSSRQFVNSAGARDRRSAPPAHCAAARPCSRRRRGRLPGCEGNLLSKDTTARVVDAPGKQALLHRLGHVEEVGAHGALGLGGTAGDDGRHDGCVLRNRCGGATRDENRAVLVANALRVQGLDETYGCAVSRQVEQGGVEVCVRIRCPQKVVRLEQLTLALERAFRRAAPSSSILSAASRTAALRARRGPGGSRLPPRRRPVARAHHGVARARRALPARAG